MFKRIGLFLMVNLGVLLTINIILNLLGVRHYLTGSGIDYQALMVLCLVYGMVGSFISLALSKVMAKWTMGLQVIDPSRCSGEERRLLDTVYRLAQGANLPKMPEVAIYDSPEVNAFATGPSKRNSLVAVSTGLLNRMDRHEVEAVLGHEVSHIANGDMVTMTLLQGVINAFVLFFAKAAAWAIANAMRSNDDEGSPSYFLVFGIEIALQIAFGMLGSLVVCWFSRHREYRADAGAAKLVGAASMVAALQRLMTVQEIQPAVARRDEAVASLKISSGGRRYMALFSTHPPLEDRVQKLRGF